MNHYSKVICETPSERILWIDSLRGLAMMLVVLGHCLPWLTDLFVIVNPFKMPLFFAISGYLINEKQNIKELIIELLKRIVVPWIIMGSIITILYYSPTDRSILHEIYNVFINGKGVWWFLPCFLWGEILFFYIKKNIISECLMVLLSLLCFFVGYLLYQYEILNIMMINRALTSQLFFCFGYVFKVNESKLYGYTTFILLITSYIALVSINMMIYPDKYINMCICQYYDMPFNLLEITIGVFFLFVLFHRIRRRMILLQYIGRNTFVIYMLHSFFIFVITNRL